MIQLLCQNSATLTYNCWCEQIGICQEFSGIYQGFIIHNYPPSFRVWIMLHIPTLSHKYILMFFLWQKKSYDLNKGHSYQFEKHLMRQRFYKFSFGLSEVGEKIKEQNKKFIIIMSFLYYVLRFCAWLRNLF